MGNQGAAYRVGRAWSRLPAVARWGGSALVLFLGYQLVSTSPSTPAPAPVTAAPEVEPPAPVVSKYLDNSAPSQPDPAETPALVKERDRIAKLDGNQFCAKELRKLSSMKAAPPQPWFDLVSASARGFGIDAPQLTDIQIGRVTLAMGKCATLAALGAPSDINRTTSAAGTREQWVYGRKYVYFVGEKMTVIQE